MNHDLPDLSNLSESALALLAQNAQRALQDIQRGKRKETIAEINRLAASIGVTVEIIDQGKPVSSRKGSKVAPKYRNPNNTDQVWTGRGMQPRWLQALIAQGVDIEACKI